MTALAAPRDTKRLGPNVELHNIPGVGAGVKIWQGALVVKNAAGYTVPATTATTHVGLGRAEETVDNTAGGNGALGCEVSGGIFNWANGDSITVADVGSPAYAGDDQTVFKSSTGRSQVGVIYQVDTDGVWVKTRL